ncbi:protein phosphatase 2C domain-containing protein [Microbacterium sp. 10M-3C3]|jgi:protein phosphatase|uniref:PP2C family protein-serine/threonine phosphatase n=1 Tax=Microbacterium sp. 10M-3C3 TaxID=2483401 RepID=UPI000F632191|nr:protein phosphatase 2C domain-containing protein [Microbacterium sp. 10M-3C3]
MGLRVLPRVLRALNASAPLALEAAAVSDVGRFRASNQDAAFTAPWGAAVADGVGGGPSGDLASAALVHRLAAGVHPAGIPDAAALLVRIREANWDLRAHVRRDPALTGMSTTFTGLFPAADGGVLLAHSGDSRGYRLRAGVLTRMTRDDSYVQVLVDSGLLPADQAATHPRRNIITASLAGGEEDVVSVQTLDDVRPGDRWLLCSDGVTDYVPEEEVRRVLEGAAGPAEAARAIVAAALEAGTRDNATAVVCDIRDGVPPSLKAVFSGSAAQLFAEDVETA